MLDTNREYSIQLHPSRCAICGTEGNATTLYQGNFTSSSFNSLIFSARRLPDRIHYRMVKCKQCGLVRSDPVADPDTIGKLYADSEFNYEGEVAYLKKTYGKLLASLNSFGSTKRSLLEIGCGNGFVLEEALEQGYVSVSGIEPSKAAIEKASTRVRPYLMQGVMRPGLFPVGEFDVICMFQVFDHISDPGTLLEECSRILKPGGLVLTVNHNIDAIFARLLRERSPIVDIEHTYLYSPATMRKMFTHYGFLVRKVEPIRNTYPLSYLSGLLPIQKRLKAFLVNGLQKSIIGRIPVAFWLGNLMLVAQKPNEGTDQ